MAVSQRLIDLVGDLEKGSLNDERFKTLDQFERAMTSELREKPYDVVESTIDYVDSRLLQKFIKSADPNEKTMANRIIDILLGLDVSNVDNRNSHLIQSCRFMLHNPQGNWNNLERTSCLLSKIIAGMGGYLQETFNHDVNKAFEFVSTDDLHKKFSGVTILRHLADRFPTIFYPHIGNFVNEILKVVRHQNQSLREAAVVALNIVFQILCRRELESSGNVDSGSDQYISEGNGKLELTASTPQPQSQSSSAVSSFAATSSVMSLKPESDYYLKCIEEVQRTYETSDKKIGREDFIHANLLILRELLFISNAEFETKCAELGIESRNDSPLPTYKPFVRLNPFRILDVLPFRHTKTYKSRVLTFDELAKIDMLSSTPTVTPQRESKQCRIALLKCYEKICKQLLVYRNSRSLPSVKVLLAIIPRLAALDPERRRFEPYLKEVMQHLLSYLKPGGKPEFRNAAFRSIGLLANYVQSDLTGYLPKVMDHLKENLYSTKNPKKIPPPDAAVYLCIRLLAAAFKSSMSTDLTNDMAVIVNEHLLACPLSAPLIECFYDLMKSVPQLKDDIVGGLWSVLKPIIMVDGQTPYSAVAPIAPSPLLISTVTISSVSLAADWVQSVVLALQTLSRFPFSLPTLNQFLHNCSSTFLFHHEPDIRTEAIVTCAHLLKEPVRLLNTFEQRGQAVPTTSKWLQTARLVLSSLIQVAISDQNQDIRFIALCSLSRPYFLPYLAQPENLHSMFLTVHDCVPKIRQISLRLVGRLADINPAYVLPTLRKLLIELMKELKYGGLARNREQAASMLGLLASSAPRLMRQFAEPLMDAVVARLHRTANEDGALMEHLLFAIGELAQVAGPALSAYEGPVLECIIGVLQTTVVGQQIGRVIVALRCLSSILLCTGLQPYKTHPELLNILLEFLKPAVVMDLQLETVHVLGLLGALDPVKFGQRVADPGSQIVAATSILCRSKAKPPEDPMQQIEMSAAEMLVTMNPSSLDDFYPAVALAALIRIFRDPLSRHQNLCITIISHILKDLDSRCVNYMHIVVPVFVKAIYDSTSVNTPIQPQQQPNDNTGISSGSSVVTSGLTSSSVTTAVGSAPKALAVAGRPFVGLMNALRELISMMRLHVKTYQQQIFDLLNHLWGLPEPPHAMLIDIVLSLAKALGSEFRPQVCLVIPHIVRLLHNAAAVRGVAAADLSALLSALQEIAYAFEDFLHLLLPPLTDLLHQSETSVVLMALKTLGKFATDLDLTDFANMIMHPLLKCLEIKSLDSRDEIRLQCVRLICCMAHQLNHRFVVYLPTVDRVFNDLQINNEEYRRVRLIVMERPTSILSGVCNKLSWSTPQYFNFPRRVQSNELAKYKPSCVDFQRVLQAWKAKDLFYQNDPLSWLRSMTVELCSVNCNVTVRFCRDAAQVSYQFARDLFNVAFVSIWMSLDPSQKKQLKEAVESSLQKGSVPEVELALLNLIEFMEHCDTPFAKSSSPVPNADIELFGDSQVLGDLAVKCGAYAKALHYREQQFLEIPEVNVIMRICEDLISINKRLRLKDAALGVLKWANKNMSSQKIPATWFQQLNHYEKALKIYAEMHANSNSGELSAEVVKSQLQCMQVLGQWESLDKQASEHLRESSPKWQGQDRVELARIGALAAWSISANDEQKWSRVKLYTSFLPPSSFECGFYTAVLAVHDDEYDVAQQTIRKVREQMLPHVTSLVSESYSSAYSAIVSLQLLAQLEQVIQYKLMEERRQTLVNIWDDRLRNCQPNVDDWQRMLLIRQLVRLPQEDHRIWTKFSSLCYKMGLKSRARSILVSLIGVDPQQITAGQRNGDPSAALVWMQKAPLEVSYAFIKYLWRSQTYNNQELHETFNLLKQFTNYAAPASSSLSNDTGISSGGVGGSSSSTGSCDNIEWLLAKCYLKLGAWYEQLNQDQVNESTLEVAINYLRTARMFNPEWYKTWHAWANINYQAVLYMRKHGDMAASGLVSRSGSGLEPMNSGMVTKSPMVDHRYSTLSSITNSGRGSSLETYCVHAVEGFLKSIGLCTRSSLQDTLRVLTLWFDFGHILSVHDALSDGLKKVNRIHWLQVIPQLIARIDAPNQLVRRLVQEVLTDTGKYHPQALVYPLTVANKSLNETRRSAARRVLDSLRENNALLVQQALLVSNELIRVAILWHEEWHEVLEEASRMYFGERRVLDMIDYVERLHLKLRSGAETLKEQSFYQAYFKDLNTAYEYCDKYRKLTSADPQRSSSAHIKYMTQAWDLYYHVFKRITKQLPQLTSLDLQYVSPKLLSCRNLELAVPGTYDPSQKLISIAHVAKTLQVITSKQRPRKLSIFGSDGQEYCFLLKGHEDLRQDERVMQLFGLVNKLLQFDRQTRRSNLTIARFSVIPLSTNSGLIGWVPHCDTLHTLIKDYREKKRIMINLEHKLMCRFAPEYERLTLLQKVEVFEHALESPANDLAKILWLKSPSSEFWFTRRTNYTRSLAVMSMVGYILGLGDRHPSNLMLQRMTGKIVHIDFGDCFEVAMNRDKFPEKIPFRLTRMLINAMEVTGIEGTFCITCECVMTVLRSSREDVLAVLEAFVYDPLLQGRIFEAGLRPDANDIGRRPSDIGVDDNDQDAEAAMRVPAHLGHLGHAGHLALEQTGAALGAGAGLAVLAAGVGSHHSQEDGWNAPGVAAEAAVGVVAAAPVAPIMAAVTTTAAADPAGRRPAQQQQHTGIKRSELDASNEKALEIVKRVRDKLTGCDFGTPDQPADVTMQVDALIEQATSHENLCQCYIGWCPFW